MKPESLSSLLDRWRGRDQRAATEIYERFEERLRRIAARRIGATLRAKLQPDSVVLFVMQAILHGVVENRYQIDCSSRFFDLAGEIADKRIRKEVEHWRQKKRDLSRVVQVNGEELLRRITSRECIEEHIAVADMLQHIRDSLTAERFEVFQLYYDGFTKKEIAARVGRDRHSISRWLEDIKRSLEDVVNATEAGSKVPTRAVLT